MISLISQYIINQSVRTVNTQALIIDWFCLKVHAIDPDLAEPDPNSYDSLKSSQKSLGNFRKIP